MLIIVTLLKQIVMMFFLVCVGYVMFSTEKISKQGSKSLGNILIYISLPCVIINSFVVDKTPQKLIGLCISAAAAALILAVGLVISRLLFPKDAIAAFAASFSNPGFFGVPLIVAALSDGAVFYVAAFIAFLNLLQWTAGVSMLTGQKASLQPKSLIKAPFLIAILIGLFFFLTGFTMPALVKSCISSLAGLNTPLAMFTIGIYLAQTDLKQMLRKTRLYAVSAVRLLVIPGTALLILALLAFFCRIFLPEALQTGMQWQELYLAVLIAAACPVGSNVAVYAQLHKKDYPYAVETVVISTLLSVITMPVIVMLGNMILCR